MSVKQTSYWRSTGVAANTFTPLQTFRANVPMRLYSNTGPYSNPPQSMVSQPNVVNSALVANPQANLTSQGVESVDGPYYMGGNIRKIELAQGGNNLSNVTFRITGLGLPFSSLAAGPIPPLKLITEDLVGSTGANVDSVNCYQRIDSIVPLQNATNPAFTLNVREGNGGITNFHNMDDDRISWNTTIQTQFVGSGSITYSLFGSLTEPWFTDPKSGELNFPKDGVPIFPIPNFTAPSTLKQIGPVTFPFKSIWAYITDALSSQVFYFTTLQQGIRS